MANITIGIIGLGRMGAAIASRLIAQHYKVYGYDPSKTAQQEAQQEGVIIVSTIREIAQHTQIIWIMAPAGEVVDHIIQDLQPNLSAESIIIDGGNSYFKDAIRRAQTLRAQNIHFIDCGTSGGIHGKEQGFCLMIGGERTIYEKLIPFFQVIATKDGYGYMGPAGAGHYVKMIHNGIEYGLLEAYAEGFQLLREGTYKDLDLANITHVWSHGSVIRSWLLELSHDVFQKDQQLTSINGEIAEGGTGAWTVQTAKEDNIPVPVLATSLEVRAWSRKNGGNFATKVIAMLRNAFGGHSVKRNS